MFLGVECRVKAGETQHVTSGDTTCRVIHNDVLYKTEQLLPSLRKIFGTLFAKYSLTSWALQIRAQENRGNANGNCPRNIIEGH